MFKKIFPAPAEALFPDSHFEDEADPAETRKVALLVGVTPQGVVYFYDTRSGKWERAR